MKDIDDNHGVDDGFGGRLRKIRSQHGMTVKQLSEISGVPEKTIYRIETGEVSDPKISSITPLIKAMNCSADELFFNAKDFTSSGTLRKLFTNLNQLDNHKFDVITESIRIMILGCSLESMVSDQMSKTEQNKSLAP